MSPGGADGHWFDRLSVAYTRRQGLKAALAAAALTLPFARAERATAAHPSSDSCKQGCLWNNYQQYRRRVQACNDASARSGYGGMLQLLYGGGVLGSLVTTGSNGISYTLCRERALTLGKAGAYDCLWPGCPGFDPDGPGGPCEPCTQTPDCKCCPDPSSPIGYTYYHVDRPCP